MRSFTLYTIIFSAVMRAEWEIELLRDTVCVQITAELYGRQLFYDLAHER